jgi:hypothetical protein
MRRVGPGVAGEAQAGRIMDMALAGLRPAA